MLTAISIEKIMGLKIENSIKKTIEDWENWNIINPLTTQIKKQPALIYRNLG